jgi:hypothetical protein
MAIAKNKIIRTPKAEFVGLAVTYHCDGSVKVAKPSIDYEGGCMGNHPEGSYCYCPSVEIVAEVACVCGHTHRFDIKYL